MRFLFHLSRTSGDESREVALLRELRVGRAADNELILQGDGISRHHARLWVEGGRCRIEDLGSRNGTRLNGARIEEAALLSLGDRIEIGDFLLQLRGAPRGEAGAPGPSSGPIGRAPDDRAGWRRGRAAPGAADTGRASKPARASAAAGSPDAPDATGAEGAVRAVGETALREEIHGRLIAALDLRRLDLDRLDGEGLRRRSEEAIAEIIDELERGGRIPEAIDRGRLLAEVLDEVLGLGPLEELLADDEISEVMVNRADQIYVERRGRIIPSGRSFSSNRAVLAVIDRIVAPLGRRIDEASPMVDARLPDGSRVHAIIPPLALQGPCITIRKFRRQRLGVEELVDRGALSPAMAAFLEVAVRARRNVLISGGTGSGKTTLLNVLASFIPPAERIITVEDAAELQIPQPHWIQLEARPPNLEGSGAVSIRELIKNCLRMRPDRIVVGECRGGEALDMLQAMNTGHDGSLTTLHANSPRDALARLETMCLMSGIELPIRAIREQIASAVDLVVHQARFADGSRRITHVTEITGMEGEILTLQEVFTFEHEGQGPAGEVLGRHQAAGFVPDFYAELERRGLHADRGIFRADGGRP